MQGEDVFVSFSVLAYLFWLSVSMLIPGAVIAFSLFRKDDMLAIEKLSWASPSVSQPSPSYPSSSTWPQACTSATR